MIIKKGSVTMGPRTCELIISEPARKIEVTAAKALILEYANSLGIDLSFQGFEQEMRDFPQEYSPPKGVLLLATVDDQPAGCVALREFAPSISEMKRLYVKLEYRHISLGRLLAESVIEYAGRIGYSSMRLDTIPSMEPAIRLYRSLGFAEIEPYRYNPVKDALFFELRL